MKFADDSESNNAFICILLISTVSLMRDSVFVALQLRVRFPVQGLVELKLCLRSGLLTLFCSFCCLIGCVILKKSCYWRICSWACPFGVEYIGVPNRVAMLKGGSFCLLVGCVVLLPLLRWVRGSSCWFACPKGGKDICGFCIWTTATCILFVLGSGLCLPWLCNVWGSRLLRRRSI
jgi:hypothetical protein